MKKKLLAGILALSVVATGALTTLLCIGGDNPSAGNPQINAGIGNSASSGNMEIDGDKNSAIRMMSTRLGPKQYAEYGVSPLAESAHIVEAFIKPEYLAEFIKLQWTVEFENPDSDWAKGKDANDYVKVTGVGDLAHQATVECLQAFGEIIIVKAAAVDNEDVFGACTCNYITRYDEIFAGFDNGMDFSFENGNISSFCLDADDAGEGRVTLQSLGRGLGTKDESSYNLSMQLSQNLYDALSEAGFTMNESSVVYEGSVLSSEVGDDKLGFDTMLYLPGADAAIVGEEQSNLIKQGYLWATTGTNDDGVLTQAEWEAYKQYREAMIFADQRSEGYLFTLILTQYDRYPDGYELTTYETQVDVMVTSMFPTISATSISLTYESIDF